MADEENTKTQTPEPQYDRGHQERFKPPDEGAGTDQPDTPRTGEESGTGSGSSSGSSSNT